MKPPFLQPKHRTAGARRGGDALTRLRALGRAARRLCVGETAPRGWFCSQKPPFFSLFEVFRIPEAAAAVPSGTERNQRSILAGGNPLGPLDRTSEPAVRKNAKTKTLQRGPLKTLKTGQSQRMVRRLYRESIKTPLPPTKAQNRWRAAQRGCVSAFACAGTRRTAPLRR